jgi:hypothetical protein
VVNNVPLAREVRYFFFFAGAFLVAFFAAAFLVAFFIEKILPKRKICNPYRSQCDSYIRLFAREVKKKNHRAPYLGGQSDKMPFENIAGLICFTRFRGFLTMPISAIMITISVAANRI